VSFIRIFDSATETVKQGGVRRGANMAVLQVDHPDILEFVRLKKDFRQATNFNISVGISDEFMRALARGSSYQLRDPRDQRVISEVSAADLFGEIVESAWVSGDPGLIFLDRMNFFNPTPEIGLFEATNPCGEQPLLPHESCNLGSLNL
jgi:ribonucleoside-diphosphate reductase alpha chain